MVDDAARRAHDDVRALGEQNGLRHHVHSAHKDRALRDQNKQT
jgi:hypothetical protein